MFEKSKLNIKIEYLSKQISNLIEKIEKNNIHEFMYILGSKKEIIKRNFLAGIFRGIGIGIGVTLITALLIMLLQKIVTLNIPVIGKYISDIIDIVERSK